MPQIEIYQRYYPPVEYKKVKVRLSNTDFSENLTAQDKWTIEEEWNKVLMQKPTVFSAPQGLATLYDTKNNILILNKTDFKTYLGISRTSKSSKRLNSRAYDLMRVAAVVQFYV